MTHPDGQRIPAGNDEPLPYVEFGVVDEQGLFDVLLNDDVLAELSGHDVVKPDSDFDA